MCNGPTHSSVGSPGDRLFECDGGKCQQPGRQAICCSRKTFRLLLGHSIFFISLLSTRPSTKRRQDTDPAENVTRYMEANIKSIAGISRSCFVPFFASASLIGHFKSRFDFLNLPPPKEVSLKSEYERERKSSRFARILISKCLGVVTSHRSMTASHRNCK